MASPLPCVYPSELQLVHSGRVSAIRFVSVLLSKPRLIRIQGTVLGLAAHFANIFLPHLHGTPHDLAH
jgi:hypothetical protein